MVKRKTNLTQLEERPVFVTDVPRMELVTQPLAQRSMFWRPAYLNQSAWIEHIPFAFWLIEAHHPRTFVELGSYSGVSYFAFCQAVERLGLDTRCFAIDTWKGDEHAGFYDESVFEKVKAYNDTHYSAFSRLVRSTFDEALKYFDDRSVDLIHIDGLHTFEAVRHDFDSWLPKLSKRGVAVFHDTNVRERNFGVYKFFGNLKRRYPHFEFVHGHGLGIVSVGNDYSELMGRLFGASKNVTARQSIHEVFSRLGRACADTLDAKRYKDKTTALTRTVADQTNKFDDLTRELAQTKQRLQTCEKDLTDSKTSLQQHLQQFAAERATNASRIAHLVSELEQLHREWALIQDSVARQKSAMSQLNEELNQAQTEIQKLRGSLDERDADLARHAEMLSGRNQQLMDLQSRLSDLQSESSAQLDQRNAIIVRLETALKMLREGHQELSIRLHARLEELGALASRLDVREHQLTEMSQESEKLTKRIAAAQEATRAKDDEIGRLRSQIASLEDASRIDSNEKASKISKLEANNKTLLSEKQALARSIEDRFREIAILTNMLQQRNSLWWHVTASLRSVRAPFLAAPRKLDKETKNNVSLIRGSGLFDEKWYLEKYPDVASDGWDPVEHYLKHGAAEGRCPGSHFDTRWYLKTYPDVQRERINPLVHFIKFGKHENRRPKP